MAGWGTLPPRKVCELLPKDCNTSRIQPPLPHALSTSSTCDKDISIPASARQRLGRPVRWLAAPQEEADLQWIELLLVYKGYSHSPFRLDLHPLTGQFQQPLITGRRDLIEATTHHSLAAELQHAFFLYSGFIPCAHS